METATKIVVAGTCGGAFGFVTGMAVCGISVAALDSSTPFDQWFSDYWSNILVLTLVPGAVIACAVFFAFLCSTGFFRLSTFVGIAGGAVFGSFIGPPESMLPSIGGINAIILLLWEWMFGGIGGVFGSLIERTVERFD